jgi:hypothetical protein
MLNSLSSFAVMPLESLSDGGSRNQIQNNARLRYRPTAVGDRENLRLSREEQSAGLSIPTVEVAPKRAVARSGVAWRGMGSNS